MPRRRFRFKLWGRWYDWVDVIIWMFFGFMGFNFGFHILGPAIMSR